MGEETDILEPMSSEDIGAAKDLTANEPSKDHRRKRKKHLYKSLKELLEFYLGDVNISKDRFINQSIQGQPFVYMELATFLKFNKVRHLTSDIEDLQKAVLKSDILQLSEDQTQICRRTPIIRKENEEECTIYAEQVGPDVDHDVLTKIFSEYGPVDYVSLPRFSHNGKCKGFAFVEFKDPVYAKKALEAFNAKGCCLSPQMAPEELLSIKNYDVKMEYKKKEGIKKVIPNNEIYANKNDEEINTTHNIDENLDAVAEYADTIVSLKKEKKKRKCSDEFDKEHNKKLKTDNAQKEGTNEQDDNGENKSSKEVETFISELSNTTLNQKSKVKGDSDKTIVQSVLNKSQNNAQVQEGDDCIKKCKAKCTDEGDGGHSVKSNDTRDKEGRSKKHKRKSSSEKTVTLEDENLESTEPTRNKFKSETIEGTGPVESHSDIGAEEDEGSNKQKKKRKRKKKLKKDSSSMSLGLKILSKKEWRQLRNNYLTMQKKTMRSLKQHLSYSKWEKNKLEEKATKLDDSKSGTVIKVTLETPIIDCKTAKSEMRVHPEVRYVDVTEGECFVYLRTSTPELATILLQTNHWPNMELLKGEEESKYWDKIKNDRETHFNKNNFNKHNQRGRTKLLKRAERYL